MHTSDSELRRDPVTGRPVIIARSRADRPHDFRRAAAQRFERVCPFCHGHEGDTPPTLAAYGGSGAGDWLVRVIANKYPAFSLEAPPHALAESVDGEALAALGAHEVIVESARHVTCFSRLDDREAALSLAAYRDRLRLHAGNAALRYAQIFKNSGQAGGASVEHIHSQLIATPFLPPELERELHGAEHYFLRNKRCVFCALLEWETAAAKRVLLETPRFVAFCPFAGRFPYETWILPRLHEPHFQALDDPALAELAPVLRAVVSGMTRASGQEAGNYFLHTAPFDMTGPDHYHWHMECFPRTTEVGGFEWATGCFINPLPPEQAAMAIQDAWEKDFD
jgi:UDPglucose--hexose-1-phosphate uridylyltransferase